MGRGRKGRKNEARAAMPCHFAIGVYK